MQVLIQRQAAVTHEGVTWHRPTPGMDPFSPVLQPSFELVQGIGTPGLE